MFPRQSVTLTDLKPAQQAQIQTKTRTLRALGTVIPPRDPDVGVHARIMQRIWEKVLVDQAVTSNAARTSPSQPLHGA